MVCEREADVLAVKLASPLYFAVMECEPGDRVDSESCAALLETVAAPNEAVPSRNVTVPVGVPPADCKVAVNTTAWPSVAGFKLDATAVVVAAWFTVCVTAPDVLAVKLPSPLYFAVMECEPTDRLDSESWAMLLETVAVPKEVAPSRNVTAPVTAPPADGTTTAVNTTVWLKVDGFIFGETVVTVTDGFTVSMTGAEVLPANFVSPLY